MGQPSEQTALIIETTGEAIARNQPKNSIAKEVAAGVFVALIVAVITWLWKRK